MVSSKYRRCNLRKDSSLALITEFERNHRAIYGERAKLINERIEKLNSEIKECELEQKKIKDMIKNIKNTTIKTIFEERYINCLSWEKIAEKIYYSLTHTHRIFKKALQDPQINEIKKYLE